MNNGEYRLFITDFSSYLFDFIKTKTKIICFFPDYANFLSGNHIYNKLHIDLEKLGGPLSDHQQVINKISQEIKRDFKLSKQTKSFYDDFYFQSISGSYQEDLYQVLCSTSGVPYREETYRREMIETLTKMTTLPNNEQSALLKDLKESAPDLVTKIKGIFK